MDHHQSQLQHLNREIIQKINTMDKKINYKNLDDTASSYWDYPPFYSKDSESESEPESQDVMTENPASSNITTLTQKTGFVFKDIIDDIKTRMKNKSDYFQEQDLSTFIRAKQQELKNRYDSSRSYLRETYPAFSAKNSQMQRHLTDKLTAQYKSLQSQLDSVLNAIKDDPRFQNKNLQKSVRNTKKAFNRRSNDYRDRAQSYISSMDDYSDGLRRQGQSYISSMGDYGDSLRRRAQPYAETLRQHWNRDSDSDLRGGLPRDDFYKSWQENFRRENLANAAKKYLQGDDKTSFFQRVKGNFNDLVGKFKPQRDTDKTMRGGAKYSTLMLNSDGTLRKNHSTLEHGDEEKDLENQYPPDMNHAYENFFNSQKGGTYHRRKDAQSGGQDDDDEEDFDSNNPEVFNGEDEDATGNTTDEVADDDLGNENADEYTDEATDAKTESDYEGENFGNEDAEDLEPTETDQQDESLLSDEEFSDRNIQQNKEKLDVLEKQSMKAKTSEEKQKYEAQIKELKNKLKNLYAQRDKIKEGSEGDYPEKEMEIKDINAEKAKIQPDKTRHEEDISKKKEIIEEKKAEKQKLEDQLAEYKTATRDKTSGKYKFTKAGTDVELDNATYKAELKALEKNVKGKTKEISVIEDALKTTKADYDDLLKTKWEPLETKAEAIKKEIKTERQKRLDEIAAKITESETQIKDYDLVFTGAGDGDDKKRHRKKHSRFHDAEIDKRFDGFLQTIIGNSEFSTIKKKIIEQAASMPKTDDKTNEEIKDMGIARIIRAAIRHIIVEQYPEIKGVILKQLEKMEEIINSEPKLKKFIKENNIPKIFVLMRQYREKRDAEKRAERANKNKNADSDTDSDKTSSDSTTAKKLRSGKSKESSNDPRFQGLALNQKKLPETMPSVLGGKANKNFNQKFGIKAPNGEHYVITDHEELDDSD